MKLYELFWGKKESKIVEEIIHRIGGTDHTFEVLDLSKASIHLFPFPPQDKILLRNEYKILYKAIEDCFSSAWDKDGRQTGGIVLLGHPGVGESNLVKSCDCVSFITSPKCTGKTVFLFYALIQRILNAQSTILRYEDGRYIGFDNRGCKAFGAHPQGDPDWVYDDRTWVLADTQYKAAENPTGIPTAPLTSVTSFFVVFSTSPKRERYYDWAKINSCLYLYMKPWTWEEIHFAGSVSFLCSMVAHNGTNRAMFPVLARRYILLSTKKIS